MKTALVTGGARRIGAAIARALAADGWRVVIHYNRSGEAAEALAAEIVEAGGAARTIACDLADADAASGLIARCVALVGPVDCLVNNASLFEPDWLQDVEPATWQKHIDVNLRAPVLLTQSFARELPKDREGCVINMLDNKVFSPNPDYFSYSVGKFGLKGLTEMAAMALGPRIRVCGVAPGLTMLSGEQTEADFEKASTKNLLHRSSAPEEVAGAVRYLAGARMVTGHIVVVDGGQTLMRLPRDVAFLDD